MSANRGIPPSQPFQCLVCLSRFTRHENLKRHAALHSRSPDAALSCAVCEATFSRPDLRRRHMKRKHPEHEQRQTRKRPHHEIDGEGAAESFGCSLSPAHSPDSLDPQHSDEDEPGMDSTMWQRALRYARHQLDHDSQDATDLEQTLLLGTSVPKPGHVDTELHPLSVAQPTSYNANPIYTFNPSIRDRVLSNSPPQIHDDWSPSPRQITRGCDLFFTHVSPFVPFLHKPTFDATQTTPEVLLSILCLAYQYGEDPDCANQPGSGATLSQQCFHRARRLITSDEDHSNTVSHTLPIVQSCLLLQICAMMYLCGSSSSSYGLKLHSHLISLARASALMQPTPAHSGSTSDLTSLWHQFISAESHKRTVFAVHQIDALWYQFLSIPRSISHLEIKHDLPCPETHWSASSAAEWAHRQLTTSPSSPGLPYVDAVRRVLTPEADLSSIPPFDPYGAINITHFLISSAREISGWSMMTGMLSVDRFGALRSSLVALNPFITPSPSPSPHSRTPGKVPSAAATWETAMIELQMWSPSHTGGIIEASIDTFLSQLTYLSPSSAEILCEPSTAEAIQPHVDWFLRYLDATLRPESEGEAPWIAVYAFKAFLIAWQLVRAGIPGAMQVVRVGDGDTGGALLWARVVFSRREKWGFGRLILGCLDKLK